MSFVRYAADDSVISSETITRGMWGGDSNNLTVFYTSSVATSSYYLNVYDTNLTTSLQFSIQYGHVDGSGSSDINTSVANITPTRVTYGQYRSLIYNDENSSFAFGSIISPDFYAINIARSRFKESIKPGSLTLQLSGSNVGGVAGLQVLHLTDDSVISGSMVNFLGSNRYYTLVSGSAGNVTSSAAGVSGSYGLMFPDLGVILLNPRALANPASAGGINLATNRADGGTGVLTTPNLSTLFKAITGSVQTSKFSLQSQETVSSRYFFTRIKNGEFNYTTNPSIINSSGSLLYDTLIDNPQTYITTVGMYNDNNELLAVAKLSRPLVKDFTKESLIRIKLDY